MNKKLSYVVKLVIGFASVGYLIVSVSTTALGEEFYKGKTIRFIVGGSPGGGFDTYTRLIARHISKHIPGHPTAIVQNMTGAGHIISANYMYNKAKPDGLTIGNWIGGLVMQQVLGNKAIQFDGRKFEWIGVPAADHQVCALTKASGIKNIDNWFASKRPVKIGGVGPGGTASDVPRILRVALGLPIKVIDGYKGTAKIRLAAEAGEVDGGCWSWQSIKATWTRMVESGGVKIVLQAMPKKHPELMSVPKAIDYAKTRDARQLLKYGIYDRAVYTRPYSLPPGTPKQKVILLRKAFVATMKDPEFLGEAKKSRLDIDPWSGEKIKELVASLFKLDPVLIVKLKEILVPRG